MSVLFEEVFKVVSLEYMLSVIVASYMTIKAMDHLSGVGVVPSWIKRAVTCIDGAILFVVFARFTDISVQCLVASFFAAVFFYDTAVKELIKRIGIDYRS